MTFSEIIDLTLPLDRDLETYSIGSYRDPEFGLEPWCSIEEEGFCTQRLTLGTQTGTHIDAPCHFHKGAESMSDFPVEALIGLYEEVTAESLVEELWQPSSALTYLLLRITVPLSVLQFDLLCKKSPRVLILSGCLEVEGKDAFFVYRGLAAAGKFLVENLWEDQCLRLSPGGRMVVAPLTLKEATGSPCRVFYCGEA